MIELSYYIGGCFAVSKIAEKFDSLVNFEIFLRTERETLIHYADTANICTDTVEAEVAANKLWNDVVVFGVLKSSIQEKIDELEKCVAAESQWLASLDQRVEAHKQRLEKYEQQLTAAKIELEQLQ